MDGDTEYVQRALDTAAARGASYADARVVDLVVESLVVKNGVVEALTRRESRGIGVRALVDGAWGFAGTADLSPASIDRIAAEAVAVARASALVPGRRADLGPAVTSRGAYRTPVQSDPFAVPLEEKIDLLMAADRGMCTVPGVTTANGQLVWQRERKTFGNSEGALVEQELYETGAGIASTTRLDDASLMRVVEQTTAIARLAPENGLFRGLGLPGAGPHEDAAGEATYSPGTMAAPPETRAAAAGVACRLAREARLGASRSVTTTGQEIAVANSHGVFAYTPRSLARVVVVAVGPDGSGYAEDNALDVNAIDVEAVARRAVDIGRRAQGPVAVPPGDYTVVLQPEAVSDMMAFLARRGFGAVAVDDGRSFVAGKRGQRVLGDNITLWDDGEDPAGLPMPFDYEGAPRRRLALIDGGVAGDIATDSYYAGKMGLPNNGHALPVTADFYAGPVPTNPFMAPGDKTVEEMIASTERGLLVTHFHYTRTVHALHLVVTGMTRDGAFLIEGGEVTRPVKNLRYTQSYLEALRDVQMIGRDTLLCGELIPARVPALKIGSFSFTGATE